MWQSVGLMPVTNLSAMGSESTKSVPFQNQTIFHFWGNSEATRKFEIPGWLEIPGYDSPRRPPKRACPPTGSLQRETSAGSPAEPGKMGLQWLQNMYIWTPKMGVDPAKSEFIRVWTHRNGYKLWKDRDKERCKKRLEIPAWLMLPSPYLFCQWLVLDIGDSPFVEHAMIHCRSHFFSFRWELG